MNQLTAWINRRSLGSVLVLAVLLLLVFPLAFVVGVLLRYAMLAFGVHF